MQKQDIARQICRSRVLLSKYAEAWHCWESVQRKVIDGMCAVEGYCWASVEKLGIARPVDESRI